MHVLTFDFMEDVQVTTKKVLKFLQHLIYAIPFLLVVYVLSIGPAAALLLDSDGYIKYPEHESKIETFYAPLAWCAGSNKFIHYILGNYIDLCTGSNDTI